MTTFSTVQPILQRKQHALDLQDLEGLLHIHVQVKDFKLFSSFYTRIDQVFILWGVITAVIFSTAQFLAVSWANQAIFWSILTLIGAWGTCYLTWYWVTVERLRWLVYVWVGLTIGGMLLTDWSIIGGGWVVLPHLCSIWLGVSAIGYAITAWGLKSRAFLVSSLLHLGAITLLQYIPTWQFLWTGIVTAGNLFLLAETQWDMQSNKTQLLSVEQKEFNQQQQQLRDLETRFSISENTPVFGVIPPEVEAPILPTTSQCQRKAYSILPVRKQHNFIKHRTELNLLEKFILSDDSILPPD